MEPEEIALEPDTASDGQEVKKDGEQEILLGEEQENAKPNHNNDH